MVFVSGHASVKTYVPVLSLYSLFAGAYIIQVTGLIANSDPNSQVFAVPTTVVYPAGHSFSAMEMADLFNCLYPDGHKVDGPAANAHTGTHSKNI